MVGEYEGKKFATHHKSSVYISPRPVSLPRKPFLPEGVSISKSTFTHF